MDDTELVVWPGSSPIVRDLATRAPGTGTPSHTPIHAVTVKIPKGSALVFPQDIAHCEAAYGHLNGRIHLFLDNPLVARKADETFPLEGQQKGIFLP